MKRRSTMVLFLVMLLCGLAAAVYHDHEMTRPARLDLDACRNNMISVGDALLLYEQNHGVLPKRIEDLVPEYVSTQMIYCPECWKNQVRPTLDEKHKYTYDSVRRVLSDSIPHRVHGLVTRNARIRTWSIPRQVIPGPAKELSRPADLPKPPAVAEIRPQPETNAAPQIKAESPPPRKETAQQTNAGPQAVASVETNKPQPASAAPVPAAPPVKPPTAESRPVPPPETNAAALAAQQGILHPTNPPKQTIVLEAEMFSDLNYGWEIKADPTTSEGAYITIKKGIANNTALLRGCGDFYNIGDNRDISRLFYTFRVPSSGMWFVQGRVKTTGTHCSNILATFMDETKFGAFGPRVVPFSWAWDAPKQVYLKAGVHHLRVYPWECGVSLDQIIITKTAVEGNAIFYANASNETHGSNTFFLVHDLDTCVLDESRPPRLNVWLRRTQDLGEGVKLKTVIGLPGGEKELPVPEFILSDAKRLVCLPIDLSGVDIKKLPCREYLLKSIVTVNGEIQCSATTALVKPFHWRVLGMLPFVMIETPLPPDGWAEEKEYSIHGKRYSWKPFENKWYDPFGVMDFGLTFANNSEYAPEHRTVYAQTMFKVLREDEYLLKSLCDDQMTLWVDGNVVRESDEFNCAIRKAGRTRVHLAAGEHKMQYRLNQSRDRWQAGVFIRTTNDLVTADIEGME